MSSCNNFYQCIPFFRRWVKVLSIFFRFCRTGQNGLPRPEVEDLCKITLTEVWNQQTTGQDYRKQLLEEIRDVENRLSKARELLISDQIDGMDYREMKAGYNSRLEKLQAKLSACNSDQLDFSSRWMPG